MAYTSRKLGARSHPSTGPGAKARDWREAAAQRWGLSRKPVRSTPETWRRIAARDKLSGAIIERLCAAIPQSMFGRSPIEGEPAQADVWAACRIAAAVKLAVDAAEGALRLLDAEIGVPIWRWRACGDDYARIDHALERFPPEGDDWAIAAEFLKVRAIRLPGDPPDVAMLRLTSGLDPAEALPIDMLAKALCDALRYVFRDVSASRVERFGSRQKEGVA
jgi:hypothetical protein